MSDEYADLSLGIPPGAVLTTQEKQAYQGGDEAAILSLLIGNFENKIYPFDASDPI